MIISDADVLKEYDLKCGLLRWNGYFEFDELGLSEFVGLLFHRSWQSNSDVCPFEEVQSPEYRLWLSQKKCKSSRSDNPCSVSSPSVNGDIDYSGYRMWRYNPIVFYKEGKKNVHKLLLKDEDGMIDEETLAMLESRQFAIMSPVTYVGRNCTYSNARYLYAFAVDLDGIDAGDLEVLLVDMSDGRCPVANIMVSSGHGVHVYFLLEKPVEMYEANIKLLNKLKAGLTRKVWLVSRDDNPQFQSVVQGFRLPGTLTKFGKPIRAFRNTNARLHTLEELNRLATPDYRLTDEELAQLSGETPYNPSRVTLSEAKGKWPEWYANRVIGHKRVAKTWKLNRGLYDWWLYQLKIEDKATFHHRYWCILTLAVYAVKAGVPREELLKDALSLVPLLDRKTETTDNHFTEDDVYDAMRAYDENYNTWPIKTIEHTTGIRIERNRRNGRGRVNHVKLMNLVRDNIAFPDGNWRDGNGRKKGFVVTAEDSRCAAIVKDWQDNHSDNLDKEQCARDTGLSLPTVRKWWKSDETRFSSIVRKWKEDNPGNENKSQCARETGLTRPTVRKWWNSNFI